MATPVLPGIALVSGSTVRLRLGRRSEKALLYLTYGAFVLDDGLGPEPTTHIRRLLELTDDDADGDAEEEVNDFRTFIRNGQFAFAKGGESAVILRIPRLDGRFAKLPKVDLEDDIFGGGKIAWKAKVRWALMRESVHGDPHTLIGVVWPQGSVRRVE